MSHRPLIDRMFAIIDGNDLASLRSVLTADCEFVTPQGAFRGPEQVIAWMQAFLDGFPGMKHRMTSYTESGDSVAFEVIAEGKHTQPLVSPQGTIPPTQRDLHLRACDFARMHEGKIGTYHVYFDQMEFLGQLGLLPPQA